MTYYLTLPFLNKGVIFVEDDQFDLAVYEMPESLFIFQVVFTALHHQLQQFNTLLPFLFIWPRSHCTNLNKKCAELGILILIVTSLTTSWHF